MSERNAEGRPKNKVHAKEAALQWSPQELSLLSAGAAVFVVCRVCRVFERFFVQRSEKQLSPFSEPTLQHPSRYGCVFKIVCCMKGQTRQNRS